MSFLLVLLIEFTIFFIAYLCFRVGSINSAYNNDENPTGLGAAAAAAQDDKELYGAVGGLPAEFLQDDAVVVVNPKRRLVEPEEEDVKFVDNYYG